MEKIDFVILWVDGEDPRWRKEFDLYRPAWMPNGIKTKTQTEPDALADTSAERYRAWDTLRYWFRGVEKFAPWVNRIHFVTWGHIPSWLDTSNPKLNIVNHRDFIPDEYLPTFSSSPIELNMHRIPGLSDRFVYFNDDMFLCRPVTPERFFRGGLPRDNARLNVIRNERIDHNMIECVRIINKRHPRKGAIGRNAGKWFNLKYSAGDMVKTLTLMPWDFWPGFREHHAPQPFLKSTFEKMWDEEYGEFDTTSRSRFRTPTDLVQWVMRYEQLVTGKFSPVSMRDMKLTKISDGNAPEIASAITGGRYSMICINDNNALMDPAAAENTIRKAFDQLLPEKSAYEL